MLINGRGAPAMFEEADVAINQSDVEQIETVVAASLHEHWRLFFAEGIILVLLGVGAVILPPVATFAVEMIIGWVLFLSGIVGLVTTFRMQHAPGFWWSLFSA